MKELDRFGKAIFSVEDPVEYKLPYITQVSANKLIGLDFQDAVKAFMRSDPDIIIVGEVRDLNTAQNMMRAAETGHLVFATLHTETIRGAITRLKDIGIEEAELKYVLRTIMVQNLMRTPCENCWGEGCTACGHRGYTGRTVVSECVYLPDQKTAERIILGDEDDRWWNTIIEDAYFKYKNKVTTKEEMVRMYGEEAYRIIREEEAKEQEVLEQQNQEKEQSNEQES
jgi:general secretion pathway protein E